MSILQAANKLDLKYTTARNIINLWKKLYRNVGDGDGNRSDNAHCGGDSATISDDNGAKVADSTLRRQLAKSTRRHLTVSIDVPERRKYIVKIDKPYIDNAENSAPSELISAELQDKICY